MKRKLSVIGDEDSDPEIRELMQQIREDRKRGVLRSPPRKKSDCRKLEDLCLYVFKLAHLDGSCQLLKTDAGVERWVWFGHEFSDRSVRVVEEVLPQIPNKNELKELRLVATRVTKGGVERLRRAFPKARVSVFTDEDDNNNWQLSQAAYDPI